MQIHMLLAGYPVVRFTGDQMTEVTNVTYDSRKVRRGSLFVCIDGYVQDGHTYIDEAIQKELLPWLYNVRSSYRAAATVR